MVRKVGRPQSSKIFVLDIDISTTVRDIGTYSILHVPSGKVYHGSTTHLYRRIIEHQRDLIRGNHRSPGLQKAYNEGGTLKLTFYPQESSEDALDEEQRLIDATPKELLLNRAYDAKNTMSGLWKNPEVRSNMTKSRIGNVNAKGTVHTTEYKHKASERLKGNKHLLGHKHSDESRRKMSEARTGRKLSPEAIRKSALGRSKGTVWVNGILYPSISEAARCLGMSYTGIKGRCRSDKHPTWLFIPKTG